MLNKTDLRRLILAQRKALSQNECLQKSNLICDLILNSLFVKDKQHFGLYMAFQNEVHLHSLAEGLWSLSKDCYLPCLKEDHSLIFKPWLQDTTFDTNQFEILEPKMEQTIPIQQIEVLFCPLVAADKQGNRLGMGRGYYDRTLANVQNPPTNHLQVKKNLMVGIAYDFQIVPSITPDAWDIPLDYLVTESGIFKTKSN